MWLLAAGMIFFSYLTDFSYFSVRKKFRKLQDTVRTGQKLTFFKGSVGGFSYFHCFSGILFSIQRKTRKLVFSE
jgi:hypothetical protein